MFNNLIHPSAFVGILQKKRGAGKPPEYQQNRPKGRAFRVYAAKGAKAERPVD
jgi:hypothetical protein